MRFLTLNTWGTRGDWEERESRFPVLKINEFDIITNDVIEAAQSTLVIGGT